jgi:S1-C subfamily serine protease
VTAVNGVAVTSAQQLRSIVASHQPGDSLTLDVRRSGSTKTLHVTLGTRS